MSDEVKVAPRPVQPAAPKSDEKVRAVAAALRLLPNFPHCAEEELRKAGL